MPLLPLVCVVVRSAKQFRLQCTLETMDHVYIVLYDVYIVLTLLTNDKHDVYIVLTLLTNDKLLALLVLLLLSYIFS